MAEGAERVLKGPPGMLGLFARAGAAMIPGASKLPLVGGAGRADDVPPVTLALHDVEIERDRLAIYDRVCSFALRDQLPATFPHVLAFPLHLSLMTDSRFPFPALGLVHVANRIVQHRPVRTGERLDLKVSATQLKAHPRGRQFSLISEARAGDELVWEESSTILRRESSPRAEGGGGPAEPGARAEGGGGPAEPGARAEGGERREDSAAERPERSGLPVTATWRLAGDLGRRYGSVSGDLNPIHIHPVSARLLGFSSAIAHGMWTKARCLAALDPQLPDQFSVEVQFRKPILLPATVEFGEQADSTGIEFSVRGAGKGTPHLDGRVSFG